MSYSSTNLEILKPKDVQHSNKLGVVRARVGAGVYLVDQPSKCPGVQGLRHGIAVLFSLEGRKDTEDIIHKSCIYVHMYLCMYLFTGLHVRRCLVSIYICGTQSGVSTTACIE